MRIAVCIKQVPDIHEGLQVNRETGTIIREGMQGIVDRKSVV